MSLSVYTRHSPDCPHADDINYRRCRCPKYIQGILDSGKSIRKSAKTRSWEKAEKIASAMEDPAPGAKAAPGNLVSVAEAVKRFISAKGKEGLAETTLDRTTLILKKRLLPWMDDHSIFHIDQITSSHLELLRDSWKVSASTRRMMQERLVGFFHYCQRHGWIADNPAKALGRVRVRRKPTDYFPAEEFVKIVDATYIYNPKAWNTEPRNQATRVRTLILLMRWSGLAISDAVGLERSRLTENDEIFLRRAKTGQPVYVPIPPDVAEALRNIPAGPAPNPRYFFWSGNGKLKSAVADWQRSMARVFKLADIKHPDRTPKRCHPHMFRDTFAVECLLAGVDIKDVSELLGHGSVKITEMHYSPWVKARQDRLSKSVRKSWAEQIPKRKKVASAR
jgi:integrase/recombinase XerD